MKLAGLALETNGEQRQVVYNGEVIASFHVISDDYAYTNAQEFASHFQDAMLVENNIRAAKDKAWSKL